MTPHELNSFELDRLIAHGHDLCCCRACLEEPKRACMLGGNCPGNCPDPAPGPGPGASGPWLRELGCRRSLGPCAYLQVSPYWQEPVFMNLLQKRVLKKLAGHRRVPLLALLALITTSPVCLALPCWWSPSCSSLHPHSDLRTRLSRLNELRFVLLVEMLCLTFPEHAEHAVRRQPHLYSHRVTCVCLLLASS